MTDGECRFSCNVHVSLFYEPRKKTALRMLLQSSARQTRWERSANVPAPSLTKAQHGCCESLSSTISNSEAFQLFQEHSTHLRKEREQAQAKASRGSSRKQRKNQAVTHAVQVSPRDPLLDHKRPRLVELLHEARAERDEAKRQLKAERSENEQRTQAACADAGTALSQTAARAYALWDHHREARSSGSFVYGLSGALPIRAPTGGAQLKAARNIT